MSIKITSSGQACGATITGVDLTKPLSVSEIYDIRQAWLKHHVISFPDQILSDDDLERVAQYFGDFGDDPFFGPIDGHKHIAAILREADETTPLFADNWHTDWSFQENPPIGTLLYGIDIPPQGGDTFFADQHLALEKMPDDLRQKIDGLKGIHSAVLAYSKDGVYGQSDAEEGRSMDIRPSDEAKDQHAHPLIRAHSETGRLGVFGTIGYLIGIEGMEQNDAIALLYELSAWQTRDEFVYRHKWQPNMLVMWDNRSVLHKASGGYEGYRRELHRITIAAQSTP